ncbi:hemolysin family protein [Chryseosolibacter indicus]|uniref:Hemolysin family protein n=1 Tax=Chryseosolibacter indicus TaxID=2782351 RepID=A0ABS5VM10_9BACT|nr:hemolysin family protein [Chryseosolibacter indicus]MBT1702482.1 hemolysin family protein [Chryseosolibacter indicus]
MLISILFTLFLVILNAFFVAAEFAIVKVRSSQLDLKAKEGHRMASLAKNIVNNLDAYLSATQLGITIASLGLGWVGESVVADILIGTLHFFGVELDVETAHKIAVPSAFVLITILHIVFGELAPKSFAIQRPESTTLWLAAPLNIFYWLFKPFIFILNGFSNFILRLIGITPLKEAEVHSPEELRMMVEQGKKSGVIEARKYEIIRNAFDFAERSARQAMVPRTHVFGINKSLPIAQSIDKILENGYSRIPVYEGTIDHIVGIIFTKDLLPKLINGSEMKIEDIMRPAHYIASNKKLIDIMKDFQKQHIQFAIVVDEFGGTEGVITMEDILEELVGEIQDEYDSETPLIERVDDKKFRVQGSVTLVALNEELPRPLPENDIYVTLAGMLIDIVGRIPNVGETINFDDYTFTVVKRIKNQIILVDVIDRYVAEPVD